MEADEERFALIEQLRVEDLQRERLDAFIDTDLSFAEKLSEDDRSELVDLLVMVEKFGYDAACEDVRGTIDR